MEAVAASAPASTGPSTAQPLVVGRYVIYDVIASGGMATVHLGRLNGPVGFSRTVAVKRLHPQFARDQEFTSMFIDEARLAARVQHPNVVSTLDVVPADNELLLIMEYVRGEALSRLVRAAHSHKERIPPRIVVAMLSGALQGLHAAHEAVDEKGKPLGLVHRDMSPQNILVGIDGTARVLDFGVAKAEGRMVTTREGQIKGKILYMPPEQLAGKAVSRTADIYAMGVVLFEALTGLRMFAGEDESTSITRIMQNELTLPGEIAPELAIFDHIVRRASAVVGTNRYATAREMAFELEKCVMPASPADVGAWVERLAGDKLEDRARRVAEIESSTMSAHRPSSRPAADHSRVRAARSGSSPWLKVVAGAVGLLLFVAGITIAYLLGTRDHTPPRAEPAATPAATSAIVAVAPPSIDKPTPSVTAPAPAPSPVAAVVSAKASATPAIAKPATRCDPPYTIDKNGRKHYIPECVQ